jgi:hypothetical protein
VSLPALAALLGHSGLTVVTWYVHPSREHQAEAMKAYQNWIARETKRRRKA